MSDTYPKPGDTILRIGQFDHDGQAHICELEEGCTQPAYYQSLFAYNLQENRHAWGCEEHCAVEREAAEKVFERQDGEAT